jgi:hypothetical protein
MGPAVCADYCKVVLIPLRGTARIALVTVVGSLMGKLPLTLQYSSSSYTRPSGGCGSSILDALQPASTIVG